MERTSTDDPMTSAYVDVNNFQGDEGSYGPGGLVLQQQWVTLTASMWPKPTASPRGWRVPSDRLPLLAAVFCGAALVVCVIFAFIVYRCCIMPKKEKHYCMRKVDGAPAPTPQMAQQHNNGLPTNYPSQSAVYAEPKGHNWGYTNRLVGANAGTQWYPGQSQSISTAAQCTHCPGVCPVPRSSSVPGSSGQMSNISTTRKQRPVSQPIGIVINNGVVPKQIPMPEISEFSPQATQYASSSILDEVGSKEDTSPSTTLKTRSLPAWVRSKPRPLSTEDDLNDLYAKVNFSKKRKNRMRNDEAAIIALSKSRSQFLHKDTDSLVDNEAVIVYDERTAL